MKKIAIIAAMQEEINSIKNLMKDYKLNKIYNIDIIEGIINNKEVVLAKSGVGKVNASRVTQILIDNYAIDYLINVGTAGSLNDELEIGDIIIANKLVQHDFDITAFGHKPGYISELGVGFYSDKQLINRCLDIKDNSNLDYNIKIGTIASGDVFCTEIDMKNSIKNTFGADCVEMEGAAIAQVCLLDEIPFIIIRSISDKPNGNNQVDFEKYINIAAKRYADFIDFFIN